MQTGNFLELCQLTLSAAQFSGTGPGSVNNAQGEAKRVVAAVQQAWLAIQDDESFWSFMADEQSGLTTANRRDYMPADLNAPELGKINKLFCDQKELVLLPAEQFVDRFRFSSNQGVPHYATQARNGKILLFPIPDKAYPVTLDYQRKPQFFSGDLDEPNIDKRHRFVIVWQAVLDLAQQEEDQGLYQHALQKLDVAITQMRRDYLPAWSFAHI